MSLKSGDILIKIKGQLHLTTIEEIEIVLIKDMLLNIDEAFKKGSELFLTEDIEG